jgi:polyhydroxyalkanoate synthesis regulator phasin
MLNRIRTIRKRWLIAATAAALLAVGLTAGAVFAAGSPQRHFSGDMFPAGKTYSSGGPHHAASEQLMQRVAEILGVEEETLTDAFATAFHEMADEQFQARIDALVENEDLTQEQADQAVDWFTSRPMPTGHIALMAAATADTERLTKVLDRMVENEMLTQDEADAIADWHAERPDFLPEQSRRHFGGRGRHGNGHDDDASHRQAMPLVPATSPGDAG